MVAPTQSEAAPTTSNAPITASDLPDAVTNDEDGGATADYLMTILEGSQPESVENESEETEAAAPEEQGEEVTDDDSEESDSEDSKSDDEEQPFYEVSVNGTKQKVSLEELRKGYARQGDYTKKSMELAETEKAISTTKAQYVEALTAARTFLSTVDPVIAEGAKIDWSRLANDDPAGYVQKKAAYEQRINQLQYVSQQLHANQQEQHHKYAQAEKTKLLNAVPEWNDQTKWDAETATMTSYLKSVGYTDQELPTFVDHRAFLVARDAAKYRQLIDARKTVAEKKVVQAAVTTRSVKPGNSAPVKTDRAKLLKQRAYASNNLDDITDAVMASL